jgi:hypothetical protein
MNPFSPKVFCRTMEKFFPLAPARIASFTGAGGGCECSSLLIKLFFRYYSGCGQKPEFNSQNEHASSEI